MANQTLSREASPPDSTVLPSICPHLGLAEDRASHEEQRSRNHRCYFTNPPQRVDLDHQRHFCLAAACADCPWLTIDDLPASVRAAEPDDRESIEQAARAVAGGLKTVADVSAPVLKEMAGRAAEAIQDGAAALHERVAAAQASFRTGATTGDGARPMPEFPDSYLSTGESALAESRLAEEPPPYRVLAPAASAVRPETARTRSQPRWRPVLGEITPDLAALGAFLAALFWLSSIYRGWLPDDMAAQPFWPVFQLPPLPLAFKVDILELSFDLGVAIPPALGALWAWLAFALLKREESGVFTALVIAAGGIFGLSRLVDGPSAIQFGLLCQVIPAVFVLLERVTIGHYPLGVTTTR